MAKVLLSCVSEGDDEHIFNLRCNVLDKALKVAFELATTMSSIKASQLDGLYHILTVIFDVATMLFRRVPLGVAATEIRQLYERYLNLAFKFDEGLLQDRIVQSQEMFGDLFRKQNELMCAL